MASAKQPTSKRSQRRRVVYEVVLRQDHVVECVQTELFVRELLAGGECDLPPQLLTHATRRNQIGHLVIQLLLSRWRLVDEARDARVVRHQDGTVVSEQAGFITQQHFVGRAVHSGTARIQHQRLKVECSPMIGIQRRNQDRLNSSQQ